MTIPAQADAPSTFKTFWLPGLLGVIVVGTALYFHLLRAVPFLDRLMAKAGPPRLIAAVVMALTLWAIFALLIRRMLSAREMKAVELVKAAVPGLYGAADWDYEFERKGGSLYTSSQLRRRFFLMKERLLDSNRSDRGGALMAGQAGVDAAYVQTAYGPLRALIWALPAFGFMGTAFEMSSAVGGLGEALGQTQGYNDLRNLLVENVVPHLAGAFDITLFALGSSVVCFILLSLVVAREETVLTESDAVSLLALAKIKDDAPFGPGVTTLVAELQALTKQVEQVNGSLGRWQQDGGVWQLLPLVNSIASDVEQMGGTLGVIQSSLQEERVLVSRSRVNSLAGGGKP